MKTWQIKPLSSLTIRSTNCTSTGLTALENALYGTEASGGSTGTDAYLPLPSAVASLLATTQVTDEGEDPLTTGDNNNSTDTDATDGVG